MDEIKDVVAEVKDVTEVVVGAAENIPTPTEFPTSLPQIADKSEGLNLKLIAGVAAGTLAVTGLIAGGIHAVKKHKAKKQREAEEEWDDWDEDIFDDGPIDDEKDEETKENSKHESKKKSDK